MSASLPRFEAAAVVGKAGSLRGCERCHADHVRHAGVGVANHDAYHVLQREYRAGKLVGARQHADGPVVLERLARFVLPNR